MKVIIQRVKEASVSVDNKIVSEIGYGYLLLVGIGTNDDSNIVRQMADKVLGIRICEDENQKMNLSIQDIQGEILSVSQFTLYADAKKGRRPSFTDAAPPEKANNLYREFNIYLKQSGLVVKEGIFQADMKVALINDGPVTIILDSDIILKK